jgi:hypothetical protein
VESAVGRESIWGGAAPNTRRALEVGYGAHVALIGRRAKLVEKINQALWDTSIKMSAELREALADWTKHREDIEAYVRATFIFKLFMFRLCLHILAFYSFAHSHIS